MKKRIWKWVGFVSLVLLVWAAVWSYYYIYRPSKLLEAMMNGDKAEIARLIDEEGYNPNVKMLNVTGIFQLYALAPGSKPDLGIVGLLLDKGLNKRCSDCKLDYMQQLVLSENIDVMKMLFARGLDIDSKIKTEKGTYLTTLDIAIAFEKYKTVEFLLEHGGKIEGYANSPRVLKNALLCIQQKKCPEILRNKFLEAGTKPELMKEIEAEIKKDSPTQGGNK